MLIPVVSVYMNKPVLVVIVCVLDPKWPMTGKGLTAME